MRGPLLVLLLAFGAVLLPGCAGQGGPAVRLTPSLYKVRHGDTLYSIAWRYGLNVDRLAAWNGLRPPYTIYPGQRLRLSPPPSARPPAAPAAAAPGAGRAPATTRPAAPALPQVVVWRWPADGPVVRRFRPGQVGKQGIDIRVAPGTPVRAAADGKVVYSGNALKGYGELVIIKHSDALLSAYAYNRRRLVAQGERVRVGQPIAEAGTDDRGVGMLHFEIRREGRPVDPLRYLPARRPR